MRSSISVHDKCFQLFFSSDEIAERVQAISTAINKDYTGKNPIFLVILNGAFMFASDIFKHLTIEAEISFVKIASYKGMSSTGSPTVAIGLETNLRNRDIIVVDDILDTGNTLYHFVQDVLLPYQPASLRIAVLLHKSLATTFKVHADYVGFNIEDKFVIGYGLDYDGLGRNYNEIYQVQ